MTTETTPTITQRAAEIAHAARRNPLALGYRQLTATIEKREMSLPLQRALSDLGIEVVVEWDRELGSPVWFWRYGAVPRDFRYHGDAPGRSRGTYEMVIQDELRRWGYA